MNMNHSKGRNAAHRWLKQKINSRTAHQRASADYPAPSFRSLYRKRLRMAPQMKNIKWRRSWSPVRGCPE